MSFKGPHKLHAQWPKDSRLLLPSILFVYVSRLLGFHADSPLVDSVLIKKFVSRQMGLKWLSLLTSPTSSKI